MDGRPDLHLIKRGEPGYDAARDDAVWNKRLVRVRSPDAIVRCNSPQDVIAAVIFARAHGLKLSPRGGGHHYEAAVLRDGGLLLDLGGLDFIEIDHDARTARVGAGVRGGDLTHALSAAGYAFPVGHCVDVGLSGYLLAGGFGWNAGEWGAACSNIKSVEVVLASGETVTASEAQHSDLFWAVRGHGAGLFAVVTAFHLQLHPLPPAVFAWRAMFPLEQSPRLADWLNAATDTADRALELGCFVLHAPDSGKPAVIVRVSACGEDVADAQAKVASFGSPPADVERLWEPKGEVLTFAELPKLSPMPAGKRVAADHIWSDTSAGELLTAIHHLVPPSEHSTVDVVAYGATTSVALPTDAALSRVGRVGAGIYALWDDPADDDANRAWVREVDAALAPYRTGRYVGEADLTLDPRRIDQCFGDGVPARLRELRARYDPEDRFFAYP